MLRPYTFPPLELALEPDWDRKLALLAERSLHEPITLVGGRAELAARPLPAAARPERQVDDRRGLADARGRRPRRGQVRPLPRGVRRGARQPADPAPGDVPLLRGVHRLRRPGDRTCSGSSSTTGSSTSSCRSTSWTRDRPTRHWLGNVQTGVNYAIVVSTCAGLWAHVIGDTVRFESLVPPLADLHRPDQVHALGLRRAPDQRGGRGGGGRRLGGDRAPRSATGTSARSSGGPRAITSTSSSSSSPPPTSPPSARRSTPTSAGATPITWRTGPRGSACRCPPWSWRGPGASTPGCGRGASSAASTRSRAWTARGRSRPRSWSSCGRPTRLRTNCPRDRRGEVGRLGSRRLLLLGDEPADLPDRVEVLDAGLVGLDGDAEALFEERDELQRADRVEDAAGDERGLVGQLVGSSPGRNSSRM